MGSSVVTAINVSSPTPHFVGVAMFSPLLPSDDLDQITCVSSFQPVGNSEFVLAVNNIPVSYQLPLERRSLPPALTCCALTFSSCQSLVLVSLQPSLLLMSL